MQPSEPTYDIHEKISQLETELLQHELLIRRQKHVINSLKSMITSDHIQSPPRPNSSGATGVASNSSSNSATTSARTPAGRNISSNSAPKPSAVPSSTQIKKGSTTGASTAVVRPINRQKKKTAMAKVAQFCKTIPKFGTETAPKRRRATSKTIEDGDAASKRSRVQDIAAEVPDRLASAPPSGELNTTAPRSSHAARSSDMDEDENDQADEEAFLASATAKLNYLNAIRSNTNNNSNASSNTQSGLPGQLRAPRATMIPVQMQAPVVQTSRAVSSSSSSSSSKSSAGAAAASKVTAPASTTSAGQSTSASSSSSNKTAKSTSATTTTTASQPQPARTITSNTASSISNTTSTTAVPPVLTTPVQNNPSSRVTTLATPITSPRNLLTGSTYKNLAIFDYCKQVRTLDEKLEVAKDMHSNIHNNPRRLQQFLDSTGGRDLFLSWLMECMDRLEAGDLRADEELARTKLLEYTVLLINQAFWNAKSVSELKFDKTLKSLYRLLEPRKEPHHITVSNIVKGIWPSYRIMRKQHESRKNGSQNQNVFVVD